MIDPISLIVAGVVKFAVGKAAGAVVAKTALTASAKASTVCATKLMAGTATKAALVKTGITKQKKRDVNLAWESVNKYETSVEYDSLDNFIH